MKQYNNPSRNQWSELTQRPQLELEYLDSSVKNILERVRKSGDAALQELTYQFDRVSITELKVSEKEIGEAKSSLSEELKSAIQAAAKNIEKFHAEQIRKLNKVETTKGVICWRKPVPIKKVGIYIPGGTAPLFSTVLMLGIPAKIAGCEDIVLCTPPDSNGKINSAILFAANLVGIKNIFKIGGAQAIAAMAYGTESIPQVYKIFGPGNQFVTKAKQLVTNDGIAIDMPAGPSEVLVFADGAANASFIAADLLSQAEHGEDSQVILVLNDLTILKKVEEEIATQIKTLPRRAIAEKALLNSRSILFSEKQDSIDFINEYAPEHLIICTQDASDDAEQITNAGSVFIGEFSAEAIGDYASGTNHTLPTSGYAKASAGVSLDSYVKFITYQQVSKEGLTLLGPIVKTMAEAENLEAHKRAVEIRLSYLSK